MTKERERKRLMISVASTLVRRIEELASIDGRPVAYMAGFLIETGVDQFGREDFSNWLRQRIRCKKKKREHLGMRQVANAVKERMQALVAVDALDDLEWLSNALDLTPVKLCGLLLDHGVDRQAIWVKIFASPISSPLWWLAGGKAKYEKRPEEFPEYLPWNREDENDPDE